MSKLAFLFLCFIFNPAYAQSSGEADLVIVKETPNAIYEDSSEHNRINKKFQMTFLAVGAGSLPGTVGGANLGYFFDRNSLINLSYMRVRQSSYSCSGSVTCSADGNEFAVSYKKFATNSFYYTLGLGRKEVEYNKAEVPGGAVHYRFNGNAIGAEISVGNQWQWKNFTLGCDWIGFNFPLTHKVESEESSGDPWDQDDLESRKEELLEKVMPLALRFYLGASF